MPARLSETYRSGDVVELLFDAGDGEQWLVGRVVGLQHPGLWVQIPGGSMWFVTNTRKIRPGSSAVGQES